MSDPKPEYKSLYKMESLSFGVDIQVKLHRPFTEADDLAASRAANELIKKLQAETLRLDPETGVQRENEKQNILHALEKAGVPLVDMEEVPNEYLGDDPAAASSPWYIVTTPKGHFKIGWRKRVIVLDYERSTIREVADSIFALEETTRGQRMIHCWSYSKLAEYLEVLHNRKPL